MFKSMSNPLGDFLRRLQPHQVVLRKFMVDNAKFMQVLTLDGNNFLQYEESPLCNEKIPQMLDLKDVFAVSRYDTNDVLTLLSFFHTEPTNKKKKPFKIATKSKTDDVPLRLGVYQFKVEDMAHYKPGSPQSDLFFELYEELKRVVDLQNQQRQMPNNALVFVNPHSGENMRSCNVFSSFVRPLFSFASINMKVIGISFNNLPIIEMFFRFFFQF